jgi:hypothetical protein
MTPTEIGHTRGLSEQAVRSMMDDPVTVARVERSRAAGHLCKPFDRGTILDTIQRAVAGR